MKAEFEIATALKGQQWEIAKGHLRALVKMQGAYSTGGRPGEQAAAETLRWLRLGKETEDFIKTVEDEGLDE